MPKLHVVTVSTRDERLGPILASWFHDVARKHGKFDVEPVDLREVNLPVFDEPIHPMKHQPKHEHTRRWAAKVAEADAFVFVTPEYNYGMPPSLLNALTYLHHEWNYKAAGFVSYGGISGGTRSVQMAKQVMTSLKLVPIPEAVSVPFFMKQIADGKFQPNEMQEKAAPGMLDELAKWTGALKTLRG